MAQRGIEIVIGRLVTDEDFRADFLRGAERMLLDLRDRGLELSAVEIAALAATDVSVWVRAAAGVDARLQKASLAPRGPGGDLGGDPAR